MIPSRHDDSAAATTAEVRTMRAVVQHRYGDSEMLRLTQIARPVPAAGEVLVRVQAAGVDRGTWHSMTGRPYMMRVMGFGFRGPKNQVPGLDVAGTVVEVGADVTGLAVGDEVFGISRGSFAEYAIARQDKLASKPSSLTFEEAAVVPLSGITALQALRGAGQVQAGQRVLVLGASGGVGSYAVQIAKAWGAHVTGVCSGAKTDFVRSLGADRVIDYASDDYTRDDVTSAGDRYDLILDLGGNSPLARLRSSLTPAGTLVIIGGENGGSITGGFGRQLRAVALSPFVQHTLRMQVTKQDARDLEPLTELIEAGKLTPALDRTYPLDETAQALRHLEAGRVRGKVAIVP